MSCCEREELAKGASPWVMPKSDQENLVRQFANHMFKGNTKAALCLLRKKSRVRVLHMDDFTVLSSGKKLVRNVLVEEHPPSQPSHPEMIITSDAPEAYPVLFESFDATMIRSAALHVVGETGPSGLDALS